MKISTRLTLTPAQSVVQYIVQDSMLHSSPFTGEPRPEVDQAWSQLLRSSMIRISEEELKRMNKTSIRLRDGSGYVGYLEAIHMLHCVKRMYQSRHPEHYVELQGTEAFSSEHWDHCLEVLRKGIMCNADVTINTYQWKTPTEIKGQSSGPRKCTDWDRIQAWADERMLKFDGVDNYIEKLVPKAVDMMTV
ncbi:hypothetical protein GGS24DRAFT_518143 [Hypoxylon argillaceum]|nr:hypothetical protein GGS24DRAFT_518143 [Hypoxylon argillaceum]